MVWGSVRPRALVVSPALLLMHVPDHPGLHHRHHPAADMTGNGLLEQLEALADELRSEEG